MDILTDVLDSIQFKANFYFRTDLTLPWSIYVPPDGNVARFHIITRGQGWVKVDGQDAPQPMTNGDLVIVPHGAGHTILDDPATPARDLGDVLTEIGYPGSGPLVYGGGGPNTGLVCGEFRFDDAIHPLLADLPASLHIAASENRNRNWIDSTLRLIANEAMSDQPGSLTIINRLAEIIFIQVIRTMAEASDSEVPFLAALADPQISKALSAIHSEPSAQWTIGRLGQAAMMSRSSFSNRFSELVGMTPHQYLTLIRMQQASRALVKDNESIATIAESTGYASEAAFSTAFKRFFGVRPGEYRKKHRASAADA